MKPDGSRVHKGGWIMSENGLKVGFLAGPKAQKLVNPKTTWDYVNTKPVHEARTEVTWDRKSIA